MRSFKRALGLGILVWLIPFGIAVLVFPIHDSWRSLFESVMAVTVAATAVGLGWIYFKPYEGVRLREGFILGWVWWFMAVIIDLPMITAGPMAMSLAEYFADIGLTYLSIPIITTGFALALEHASSSTTKVQGN